MVFRSVWQRLLEWTHSSALGTEQITDLNDQALKAQAIQNADQAQNLIAIENARATMKIRMVALVGTLLLVGLVVVVAAVLFIVHAAGQLKLPWSRMGTFLSTFAGTAASAALAWWARRALSRRRESRANAANPPENRTEDDQNPVGAP
ncbi:hypothetical protein [Streptomyces sp. NPDC056165]|uniref:hypothetical protein n=1 Tax=Streptomyces sp. NPDC056165 TaxID=3345733 RepID=UPI0035DA5327